MNLWFLWVVLGVVFCSLMIGFVKSQSKKAWYKIYLANNDIRLMYRAWGERWRSSDKYPKFKDDNGHEFTFPSEAHWCLMWERIPDSEVGAVRVELAEMGRKTRKGEEE